MKEAPATVIPAGVTWAAAIPVVVATPEAAEVTLAVVTWMVAEIIKT